MFWQVSNYPTGDFNQLKGNINHSKQGLDAGWVSVGDSSVEWKWRWLMANYPFVMMMKKEHDGNPVLHQWVHWIMFLGSVEMSENKVGFCLRNDWHPIPPLILLINTKSTEGLLWKPDFYSGDIHHLKCITILYNRIRIPHFMIVSTFLCSCHWPSHN